MQFPINAINKLLKFNFFFLPVFFLAILLLKGQKSIVPDLSSSRTNSPQQFVQSFRQIPAYDQQLIQDQQRKIAEHSQEIQHLRAVLHSYERQVTAYQNKITLPTTALKSEAESPHVSPLAPIPSSTTSNPSKQKVVSTQPVVPKPAPLQPANNPKPVAPKDEQISSAPILPSYKVTASAVPPIANQPFFRSTKTQEIDKGENTLGNISSLAANGNSAPSLASSLVPTLTTFPQTNSDRLNFHDKEDQKSFSPQLNKTFQSGKNNFIHLANDAAFGLIIADQKGHITYGTYNYRKVQTAIKLLRQGKDPQNAAKRSNLSPAILAQLIKWGDKRPGRLDIDAVSYQKPE